MLVWDVMGYGACAADAVPLVKNADITSVLDDQWLWVQVKIGEVAALLNKTT